MQKFSVNSRDMFFVLSKFSFNVVVRSKMYVCKVKYLVTMQKFQDICTIRIKQGQKVVHKNVSHGCILIK